MDESSSNNMVSNLPLLFAGGYPTSLDKITETQLEKFVPFMVQCSLGYIHLQTLSDYSEPEWWPVNLQFTYPFSKPKHFKGDWLAKMKKIVLECYSFHKCIFLLRFCNDLATYEPESLRFINNYNSTTSLFHRKSNKLLVTFRNENMLYDHQQPAHRKYLLPKFQSSLSQDVNQQMVEPVLFDIYLCDNCDAELYSLDAYLEHEKTKICIVEDDDVILCESPIETHPMDDNNKLSAFLLNLCLKNVNSDESTVQLNKVHNHITESGSQEISRVHPRRARGLIALNKCHNIAYSSPLGQLLIKKSKTNINDDYLRERLDRLERFCHAPVIGNHQLNKPKWLGRKYHQSNTTISYKGADQRVPYRTYNFPRRQFSNISRKNNFLFINSGLLKVCKPVWIKMERLSATDIESKKNILKSKSNVKKQISVKNTDVVECIDLCSSDEEDTESTMQYNRLSNSIPFQGISSFCEMPTSQPLRSLEFVFSNINNINSKNPNNLFINDVKNQENVSAKTFSNWMAKKKSVGNEIKLGNITLIKLPPSTDSRRPITSNTTV